MDVEVATADVTVSAGRRGEEKRVHVDVVTEKGRDVARWKGY